MARYIHTLAAKPLTAAQLKEASELKLDAAAWRWFNAIRKEGAHGVAWGCLPSSIWKRLVLLGLIQGNPFEVWVKGAR